MSDEKTFYEILGVENNASKTEIRKAYLKLALNYHPDKNPDENTKEKFQQLQKIYSILIDNEKRKIYDENGCTEDIELDVLYRFFKSISEEDIIAFESEYLNSEMEKKDLIELYIKFNGDMKKVFENQICCDPAMDEHRFADMIKEEIKLGNVKSYSKFETFVKKIENKPRSSITIEQRTKNKSKSNSLIEIIKNKNAKKPSIIDYLSNKYDVIDIEDDLSDSEFKAIQEKLMKKKQSKKGEKNKLGVINGKIKKSKTLKSKKHNQLK